MTARDVQKILGARVLTGEEFLDREITSACASDMMSDVLAFSKDHSVLITGLCNPQVIRTAEMLDIVCVIFVRRKNQMRRSFPWQKNVNLLSWKRGIACIPPAVCSTRRD